MMGACGCGVQAKLQEGADKGLYPDAQLAEMHAKLQHERQQIAQAYTTLRWCRTFLAMATGEQ